MSLADINAAAAAQNALTARLNTFLDDVDGNVAAAITQAQTELGTRQNAYDALAENLKDVVRGFDYVTVTFDPNASAADLSDGGVFRNWDEFMDLNNSLRSGSYVHVLMTPGETLEIDSHFSPKGHRHWLFDALTYVLDVEDRPLIRCLKTSTSTNLNAWYNLNPGRNGTVQIYHVNCEFGPGYIPTEVSGVDSTIVVHAEAAWARLVYSKVTGPEVCRVLGGGFAEVLDLSLSNVHLDGLGSAIGVSLHSVGRLSARFVTLSNGTELFDNTSTVGANLLLGQHNVTTITS